MTPTRERRQTASQGIRRKLQLQIGLGRTVILLMLVATLLNQLLLLMNVDFHFRLSASVPHYLNWLARELAGASGVTLLKLFAILVTMLTFLAYVACWVFSAQRRDLLKIAFWLYSADTVLLVIFAFALLSNPFSCLLEMLIHLAVIAVLYFADRGAQQLRKLSKKKRTRPAPKTQEHRTTGRYR